MTANKVEVSVGVFAVLGIAALLFLAVRVSNLAEYTTGSGYTVSARFTNIGGLKLRAPVTVAGVRIGRVTGIDLDERSYQAVVKLTINDEFARLPTDSSASILTAGLLGEQYVAIEAGADETFLGDQGEIKLTESAFVLEHVVSHFLYNQAAPETPRY